MYELTQLFWYRPIFMTELILAEGLFMFRLSRKKKFGLRLSMVLLFLYGISFGFPIASYNAFYCSFMFLCLFLCTVGAALFLFEENWVNILFCSIAGYTLQHVAYEIDNLIVTVSGIHESTLSFPYGNGEVQGPDSSQIYDLSQAYLFRLFISVFLPVFIYVIVYTICYCAVYFLLASKMQMSDIFRIKKTSLLMLSGLIVLIDIVAGAVITYSEPPITGTALIMLYLYNIACCFLVFYIQFELPKRRNLERELDTARQLRQREREQYVVSKENIELINMKCHDLRNQVRSIGTERALGEDTIHEIERVISIYDSAVKTGNDALDVILTEKNLMCSKRHIRFTCIVDGASLSFISDDDLYSLFGNIVDNAIDAVEPLDETNKVIGLTVRRVGGLLSISEHNYFSGELKFEKGLPLTTKSDSRFHGFGLKSIRYIVEKYGGELSLSASDGEFHLNIVFPLDGN